MSPSAKHSKSLLVTKGRATQYARWFKRLPQLCVWDKMFGATEDVA